MRSEDPLTATMTWEKSPGGRAARVRVMTASSLKAGMMRPTVGAGGGGIEGKSAFMLELKAIVARQR